jgi:hypothetical protein
MLNPHIIFRELSEEMKMYGSYHKLERMKGDI